MGQSSAADGRSSYHHGALREALLDRAAEVIEAFGIEALTLRGLARDLGVSHTAPNRHFKTKADLLGALAATGYYRLRDAVLAAAAAAGEDPLLRLNAMGRGYLRWVFEHPSSFRALSHPDVERHADQALHAAMEEFEAVVTGAVVAAQQAGLHPTLDTKLLTAFLNAVPFGIAMLTTQGMVYRSLDIGDQEAFIADLTELVVPVRDR